MEEVVRKLFKERNNHANVLMDLVGNIVSILEHPVVRVFVSIMQNAWLKQATTKATMEMARRRRENEDSAIEMKRQRQRRQRWRDKDSVTEMARRRRRDGASAMKMARGRWRGEDGTTKLSRRRSLQRRLQHGLITERNRLAL
ncbi:hypothetical protein DEO72_LG5g1887 [Vigna unguiculata]|uniref:Uncharacterized protein n=1 Tax=Vigna unguiculata TaxID=3917 RepID=A0A4D6LZN4_VIGUN|nr:hypothetical protein DEO72_LG5g1887 [Vigna unguiculata]